MKKLFIILAVLCLVAGVVGTITDYQDTTAQAEEIRNYPVVKADELSTYMEQDARKIVVTDIQITGTLVEDPKKFIDGSYYYLCAAAEEYYVDSDGEVQWYDKHKMDYEVQSKDLTTNAAPEEPFFGKQVFYPPELAIAYEKGVDSKHLQEGDIRYHYSGIKKGDTMTALMTVGDGKAILETLLKDRESNYIVGNEKTYYEHVKAFLVGDSFLLLIAGILFALLFGFLAVIWSGKSPVKRAGERLSQIGAEKRFRMEEYKELLPQLKRRYWIFRIGGSLMTVGGLAIIVVGYQSVAMISIGTVILIFGITAFNSALSRTYNESTGIVHMVTMSQKRTIEEFYKAYQYVNTPLGTAWLGTFRFMSGKAMVWGPDPDGQILYFWIKKNGLIGYAGYSYLDEMIKEHLTIPAASMGMEVFNQEGENMNCQADVMSMQQELFKSLEHYGKTGEVLPIGEKGTGK